MSTATHEATTEEHFLESRFPASGIAAQLLSRDTWAPYPTIADRAGWHALAGSLPQRVVAEAESLLDFSWPHLPATLFLEYARIGNRINYEEFHFERRRNLIAFVLAECIEARGRFLDQIVNGVWALCEESFWGVPAHNRPQVFTGSGLPDTNDHYVDLFAAETGALLSWTHYLLKSAISEELPVVLDRIEREVQVRILKPYRERDDFVWLGFTELERSHPNNWNPWIHSNVLVANLLMESDEAVRASTVARCMKGIDRFIGGYEPDGGCDEGIMYWGKAGASLFDCLEILRSASDGKIDVYDENLIQQIGRYPYRMHIGDQWFVNFADGGAKVDVDAGLVYRYGKRIGDEHLQALGVDAERFVHVQPPRIVALTRALADLFEPVPENGTSTAPSIVQDNWMPGIQVLTAHESGESEDGLFLAAKGGHNAESHNHNDIGSFIVGLDGRPLVIDVGVETYRKQTFSAQRYEIWTMQSGYHNLPTINGHDQAPGRQFRAREVSSSITGAASSLTLDIAGAYEADAGVTAWLRTSTLHRGDDARVTVTDAFDLTTADSLVWNVMTAKAVEVNGPGVLVTDWEGRKLEIRFDTGQLEAATERIEVTDARLTPVWGDSVYRTRFTAKHPATQGEVTFTFARA